MVEVNPRSGSCLSPISGSQARLQLVLGPARSGKSRWAEHLAAQSERDVVYVATGPQLPADEAWQQRIQRHRLRRPAQWSSVELEKPGQLGPLLRGLTGTQLALVDSLGSWVARSLELDDRRWQKRCDALLGVVARCSGALVIVSEQTGWGVVPPTAIGGLFRDRLGSLERRLVCVADTAWLVVAGRAVNLREIGIPVPPD
ncbi:MAG: bifunctional adenosylcobinamide kinase/adenosylcobinamide-phosphate guanylyltransferase [Cyanobacteriota bacterium]|nr:bifunctional adenosylcobinamide kinase/adenosylcobinamide-phosphate guanylyltransferase [Cyanobacteriota bacterium]